MAVYAFVVLLLVVGLILSIFVVFLRGGDAHSQSARLESLHIWKRRRQREVREAWKSRHLQNR